MSQGPQVGKIEKIFVHDDTCYCLFVFKMLFCLGLEHGSLMWLGVIVTHMWVFEVSKFVVHEIKA